MRRLRNRFISRITLYKLHITYRNQKLESIVKTCPVKTDKRLTKGDYRCCCLYAPLWENSNELSATHDADSENFIFGHCQVTQVNNGRYIVTKFTHVARVFSQKCCWDGLVKATDIIFATYLLMIKSLRHYGSLGWNARGWNRRKTYRYIYQCLKIYGWEDLQT